MNDRAISYTAPMVRAVLEDRKIMTRRIIKPPKGVAAPVTKAWTDVNFFPGDPRTCLLVHRTADIEGPNHKWMPLSWYPGQRLWVREAWRVGKPHDATKPKDILPPLVARGKGVTVLYEAGGWRSVGPEGRDEPKYPDNETMPDWAGKKRAARFMPKVFSRTTLVVTEVRVERLQDISDADAIAEGIESIPDNFGNGPAYCDYAMGNLADTAEWYSNPGPSFRSLWHSIHGAGAWAANPFVAAISFTVHRCNIRHMPKVAA